jgi:hypothetical protein
MNMIFLSDITKKYGQREKAKTIIDEYFGADNNYSQHKEVVKHLKRKSKLESPKSRSTVNSWSQNKNGKQTLKSNLKMMK